MELSSHEQANVVHEEYYLVGTSDFEKWIFALKRSSCQCEVLLDIVCLILFFVGANYVRSCEANVGGKLTQPELLRFFQLLCVWIHKDERSLFSFGNDSNTLQSTFFLPFVDTEVVNLNISSFTF